MIDLHCHILPGIDDGAEDLATSLQMARLFHADGVTTVACTPHILPGLYNNTGHVILQAMNCLREHLHHHGIPIDLVCGADAHMCPDFIEGLKSGRILSLAGTRYVLVEPPHHVAPARIEQFFFDILMAGYVPILTHPERLRWINNHYDIIRRLTAAGVWNQLTSSSLTGAFGKNPQYWSERMLDEGLVHILASDAHDVTRRTPNLSRGRDAAAKLVGEVQAEHLVLTRPRGILANHAPSDMPLPHGSNQPQPAAGAATARDNRAHSGRRSWADRLRRLFT